MLLRNTLFMLAQLEQGDKTTTELVDHFGSSAPTIKRMVAEARRMGADVVVTKHPEFGYRYHLQNAKEIRKVLDSWLNVMVSVVSLENKATYDNALTNPNSVMK